MLRRITILLLIVQAHYSVGQIYSEVGATVGVNHSVQLDLFIGGGVTILDYDNDGYEDMYLTGGNFQDRLYRNNGNGTFADVSEQAGILFTANLNTLGVAAGDIDNDGDRDLFVTTGKEIPNILLINNGDGTFSDISQQAGITHSSYSTSVTFGDVNLDGLLDIYVANFIIEQGFIYDLNNNIIGFDPECSANYLYINQGNGVFVEKASVYGVANIGCGLATAFTDYDNDKDVDIMVANDFGPWHVSNTLYQNKFPVKSFSNQTTQTNYTADIYGMGIAIGDIDNDMNNDYYVTNLGRNVFYYANGDGTFTDLTTPAKVEDTMVNGEYATGWGTMFLDYDNDGFMDLFVNNGQIPSGLEFTINALNNPDRLFRNNGDKTFEDVTDIAGMANDLMGRGSAYFDYDNDGDLDIISVIIKKDPFFIVPIDFFENNESNNNHWLKVKLQGVQSNKDAIGSQVIAYAADGNKYLREIDGGSSFLSQNSIIAHYGIGTSTQVDSLLVHWSGGISNIVYGINIDTINIIEEEVSEIEVTTTNCNQEPTIITLTGTKDGASYALYNLNSLSIIGSEQIADGTPMTFSTGVVAENSNYQIRVQQGNYTIALDTLILKRVAPVIPIINILDTQLASSIAGSYVWFLDSVQISTEPLIIATQSGKYWVEVTDYYGCVSLSDPIDLVIAGIDVEKTSTARVFPNPSTGKFELVDNRLNNKSQYTLFDRVGRQVSRFPSRQFANRLIIDITNYRSGVYLLKIVFQNGETSTMVMNKLD